MSDMPFVKMVAPIKGDLASVVVLDPIEPGVTPDYCVHGKTTCWACDDWCWLGDKTYELVSSGEIVPLCLKCAARYIPSDSQPDDHVEDHR